MTAATVGRTAAREAPARELFDASELARAFEVRFAIVGQLQRAAEVRMTPDGLQATLTVRLRQPCTGVRRSPVIVASFHAFERDIDELVQLAALLTPGAMCLALCRGLDVYHKRDELHAWRCDRITAIGAEEAARFVPDSRITDPADVPC